ncbi:MAG: SPFH domain-containing protein [Planctomycetaceae bacterium]|nr:SPFH domain-containing protein [Planctomycetaceae bacterium]
MGLFDKLRHEFIDIIEWLDDTRSTLVWRFPRYQNEIKQGAQLIVRPGQIAAFVHRGQVADVFEPGPHTLNTQNLPLLSTLAGWKHGFNSPFRSEVYFISTRQITDLKWGTPNPVMLRDPEFGPIRLRAFGTYALKAVDAKALLTELVGTDGVVEADEIGELMRSIITEAFADMLAEKQIAALDLAAHYREFSEELKKYVSSRIDDEYGLDVPQLFLVNISFPEAVEKVLDQRTGMGIVGDVQKYQQFQLGQAIGDAGKNPGSAGGDGLGLGIGLAMAGRMMNMPGAMGGGAGTMAPPPLPTSAVWHVAVNGQTQGPFAPEQVQQGVAAGQVTAQTLVWAPHLAGWIAAGEVPELKTAFNRPSPPPLPPAP